MEQRTLSQRLHLDFSLILCLLAISITGLIVIYSAANQDMNVVIRQSVKISIGFFIMIIVAQIPTNTIQRWSVAIYVAGLLLLVGVLLFGDVGKGAQRWLDLGFFRFQPSEILKLSVPMVIAWYFSDKELPPNIKQILFSLLLVVIPVVLIAKQPDLGTALLVAAAGISVLFIAGINWKLIAGCCLLAIPGAFILWMYMHDYQKQRVLTFLNPEQDPLGSGYHIIQSKIAIGSGGVYGKGWLNGTQSHLEFLPERSTDFIFAVFCEEFGFVGVVLLIMVYGLVIARCLYISATAQENYGRLLGAGIILTFFVYLFVNIGMVSGQLPVVGVPLPLVSLGGTSMVTLMIGFGILMSINTHKRLLSQ